MTTFVNTRQAQAWNGSVGLHWATHQQRYDALLTDVNDALFAAAAVRPADRVLDVGCGAGTTTRIAARLAARGHAVGVDISAPLLRRAQELTAAEKIHNATYTEADAQVHAFPSCGYDVIVSRGGVMFFADHAAAFRNLRRALMPGGRLAFVCPQPAGPGTEEGQALRLFGELLGGPDPDTAAALAAMASLSDPDRIRAVLEGWENVEISPVSLDAVWGRDAADAVDFILSRSPGRPVPAGTRTMLEDSLRPYESRLGVRLRGAVWLVTANRPVRDKPDGD
ncbi:class I SAM-dependent methyltransferase [Streptomyces spinosisporus]|uniref:Class I SAM-dependent methyltransferase n=1 Tax=Streptomyces spinosisporus TaxID=2927582 RepID=A0ABS9X910_9ACTN|nr:class I SAM-dependent methyltransferase [Streptomyces spinosisporus]MCI3238562.1 class I SAM-dependent methyltransferase [Streptomyces spinosisporus]